MSKKRRRNPRRKVEKRIKEFRKERTKEGEGHPRFFYKRRGRRFFGLGLTHGKTKDGHKSSQLTKNPEPNPKDKRPVRIVHHIEEVPERNLSNNLEDWAFTEVDEKRVFEIIAQIEAEQQNKRKK